jgi:uncharacterized protein
MKNILFVFVILMGISHLSFGQNTSLMDFKNNPLIEVEGKSEIKVQPDESIIHVTVTEKGNDVSSITKQLNKKVKSIEEGLKKTKVKNYKLVIDNYNIYPNTVYKKDTWVEEGYVASQTLKITIKDIGEEMIKIIEKVQETPDINFRLGFGLSDGLQKSMENTLIKMAIEDARSKGQLIADSFNYKKLQVLKVNYSANGGGFQPVYQPKQMRMAMEFDMSSSPTVIPEEMTLSDRVMVSFVMER